MPVPSSKNWEWFSTRPIFFLVLSIFSMQAYQIITFMCPYVFSTCTCRSMNLLLDDQLYVTVVFIAMVYDSAAPYRIRAFCKVLHRTGVLYIVLYRRDSRRASVAGFREVRHGICLRANQYEWNKHEEWNLNLVYGHHWEICYNKLSFSLWNCTQRRILTSQSRIRAAGLRSAVLGRCAPRVWQDLEADKWECS